MNGNETEHPLPKILESRQFNPKLFGLLKKRVSTFKRLTAK
jgi:hypothetical protein